MDWNTIITSIGASIIGSGAIGAVIIYIVKKVVDKSIETKYEKILEENRLQSQEEQRRKATLYDKQENALSLLITNVYKLRRISREILNLIEGGDDKAVNKLHEQFRVINEEINKVFANEHIYFTSAEVAMMTASIASFNASLLTLLSTKNSKKRRSKMQLESAQKAFQDLDEAYKSLHHYIQLKLGIVFELQLKDQQLREN